MAVIEAAKHVALSKKRLRFHDCILFHMIYLNVTWLSISAKYCPRAQHDDFHNVFSKVYLPSCLSSTSLAYGACFQLFADLPVDFSINKISRLS